jgi:hypothetical protein
MLGFLARKGSTILALAFAVASAPLDHARAGSFYLNVDENNNSGSPAYGLEIGLGSNFTIQVDGTYQHTSPNSPSVAFPNPGAISGSPGKSPEIEWKGATIGMGVWTHVGAYGRSANDLYLAGAHWLDNSGMFSGAATGTPSISFVNWDAPDFGVVRVTMYGGNGSVLGHAWWEVPAQPGSTSFATVVNADLNTPTIYASWAYNTPSPTPIPIQDLNESLTGFGPESPITSLSIPEPSSLLLLGLGACGCVLYGKRMVKPIKHPAPLRS